MAEKKFDAQVNYGWGLSLNMTGKAPAVAKRIFNTLSDAQAYADDVKDSAIEGLVLSVVADGDKNGVYFVQSIKTSGSTESAVLVKLGSASDAADGADSALAQAKAYTDQLANGAVKTNTDKITILNGDANTNGSVAKAVETEKSRAMAAEKTNADAITAETNARITADEEINTKIGTVPEGKNVVGMIASAEAAAKAAATKMKLATSEAFLTLVPTTDDAGATTYTIGTKDLASDVELQDEVTRATAAEGRLQTQIGKAATEQDGPTGLHKEIADVKAAYETAIDAMDATKTGEGTFVDVTVKQANGVITEVTVAESDIASANALTAETNARTDADTALANRITKIEGDEQTVGSIKKAVADAKSELLGDVATDYNTLGKLEDKIIKVSGDAKTYRIDEVVGDELTSLGANVKEAYKLVENGNARAGEYIKVYKDSSLQSVALVGQKLQFTYLLASGQTSTVSVDVSNFLAESEFANGLQVVDHVVSVKRDSTSEGFLTVGTNGIKLSGVQTAIDTEKTRAEAAEKTINDKIGTVTGTTLVDMINDAKAYTDTKISSLDADVTSTGGSRVTVKVKETDGVISAVTVTETDIASAQELDALEAIVGTGFTTGATVANKIDANKTAIDTEVTNRTKAVSDAKASIISGASSDYNTLGKLEQKVKDVAAAAKAAETKIAAKTTGHVTVSSSQDKTTSALTYTISETDIASANELNALKNAVGTGFTTASTVADHITVLEGVTVTGENAIAVSASGATESKVVSLKLGAQPAEGVAGVVLSQDANGLVAKLQWGTF